MQNVELEFVPVDENQHVWIVHPRNLHWDLVLQPDLVDLLQKHALAEKKTILYRGFYLVLLLIQEKRVAALQALEMFFFRKELSFPFAKII